MEWLEFLRELNLVTICVRVVLAMIIGGILGLERGMKNRPAGFRTYMLVCLGAALVMMTNQFVFQYYEVSDPVRMGAQVVSGIGFLGAGTIMMTNKSQVKGITTAAGLWTAACSGLAIGIGFYEGAIIGGIAVYFIMATMQSLDGYLHSHSNVIGLYMEYDQRSSLKNFLDYARQHDFDISDLQISKNKLAKDAVTSVVLTARTRVRRTHTEIIEILSTAPGVEHLEEV